MSAEAKDIAFNIIKAVEGCSCDDCLDKAAHIIARATAAENERCVRVIEGLEWFIELSPDHVRGRKPEEYASAIRSHPKKLPAGDGS